MNAPAKKYEMKAGLASVEAFDVVGISVQTSRETATDDINALWERFFKESIGQKITHKTDDVIYCAYSDYEGDFEAPYRVTIGYKVTNTVDIGNFTHVQVQGQDYAMMSAAGEQPKALLETWNAIWDSDLDRAYNTDFEIYGPNFFKQGVNEVVIAIGLNTADLKQI